MKNTPSSHFSQGYFRRSVINYMKNPQDIPSRRVYVVKPKLELKEHLSKLGKQDLFDYLNEPTVLMTEELPFEEFIEGWRTKIKRKCKEHFIESLSGKYCTFETKEERDQTLGTSTSDEDLFDKWWSTEEADYMQIETNWKS